VAKFKYLGTTDQDFIHKEIKGWLNQGMIATILFRIFCLPVSFLKSWRLKHKIILLPVVWCVCKTWSLILRADHRLRVLENRMLGRRCGPKREEVVGGCRRPCKLYTSPNIIRANKSRRMRCTGHAKHRGEMRNA